jgi:hypothetical protein
VLLVCTVYSVPYGEIALSRKPFGIGHVYVSSFLIKMTDTMTSQNIDPTSWDICIMVNIRKAESRVEIADQCATWKISNGAGNLRFYEVVVCR